MGILFKQVSPAWLLHNMVGTLWLVRPEAAEASRTCPTRCHTPPHVIQAGCPPCRAVPVGRQDLHVQPVQDSLHGPRTADQQGGGHMEWQQSGDVSQWRSYLALSIAGLVAAPAAPRCPTRRPSKGGTAAPTCSAMCECGVIRCALVAPAPHRALAACPTLLRPYPPLLQCSPNASPACPACPGAA